MIIKLANVSNKPYPNSNGRTLQKTLESFNLTMLSSSLTRKREKILQVSHMKEPKSDETMMRVR